MNDRPDTARRPPGFLLGCLGTVVASLAITSLLILGGVVARERWHLWGLAVYAGVLLVVLMAVVGHLLRDERR